MKRVVLFVLLLLSVFQIHGQVNSLDTVLTGYKGDGKSLGGMDILSLKTFNEGALIKVAFEQGEIYLSLIGPVPAEPLEKRLSWLGREVLSRESRQGENRNIIPGDIIISIGTRGEFVADIELNALELQLEDRVSLDFKRRLSGPLRIELSKDGKAFYRLPLDGINLYEGDSSPFLGWGDIEEKLLIWARNGAEDHDQKVMGTVLEIRRLSEDELEEEIQVVLDVDPLKGKKHWANLVLSLELADTELLTVSADGVFTGIPSLTLEALLSLDFIDLGGKKDKFKPYEFRSGLGFFTDPRFIPLLTGEYEYVHQVLPAGISLVFSFHTYQPLLDNEYRLKGKALGLGFELGSRLNLMAILGRLNDHKSPQSEGEYLFQIDPALVLTPGKAFSLPLEMTLGLPLKFIENHNSRNMELYSMGVSIGFRFRPVLSSLLTDISIPGESDPSE